MLTTFKYQVIGMLRDKVLMVWSLGFIIVLSLIFMAMFSNLQDSYEPSAQPFGIVQDDAYDAAPGFDACIRGISDEDAETRLVEPTFFANADDARAAAKNGDVVGYIDVEDDTPTLHVTAEGNDSVTIMVLRAVLDAYVETRAQYRAILSGDMTWAIEQGVIDPTTLASFAQTGSDVDADAFMSSVIDGLASRQDRIAIEKAQVTHQEVDASVRYYFSLLAFACGMGMTFSMIAIRNLCANTSALGARQTMAGMPRWKMLVSCLAASWACIMGCLLAAFLFLKFFVGVDFGSRQVLCIVVLGVSSLMSCAAGAVFGTMRTMTTGMISGITCLLSLFTGLYGTASQKLADFVEATVPVLSWANPLWESTHGFFSLLYYDTLGPFAQNCTAMLGMAAIFMIIALARMRRMSYEHL
ncbi:ABC transporter permease [Slackia exigua]|uniref:ABC transporter permease n=1 Tax=Slackia exigua TaxID=84109 RepID=UPI003AB9A954